MWCLVLRSSIEGNISDPDGQVPDRLSGRAHLELRDFAWGVIAMFLGLTWTEWLLALAASTAGWTIARRAPRFWFVLPLLLLCAICGAISSVASGNQASMSDANTYAVLLGGYFGGVLFAATFPNNPVRKGASSNAASNERSSDSRDGRG